MAKLQELLKELYYSHSNRAVKFRYGLLIFDFCLIGYVIFSSFFIGNYAVSLADKFFGILILFEVAIRIWISPGKKIYITSFYGFIDLIVVASLLIPLMGGSMAFLRVVRIFRLLRSYQILDRLRKDSTYFKRNEEIILSAFNLFLFIFIMTSIVFETQVWHNPKITNYIDALYFTVTTLTTTGFGDVTLHGTGGKIISVIIMIFGVSLFLRLIQTVFRPHKVRHACPECGLMLHDRDAVCCKHCGITLNIPDEGL